jgi:hypothetical protein
MIKDQLEAFPLVIFLFSYGGAIKSNLSPSSTALSLSIVATIVILRSEGVVN